MMLNSKLQQQLHVQQHQRRRSSSVSTSTAAAPQRKRSWQRYDAAPIVVCRSSSTAETTTTMTPPTATSSSSSSSATTTAAGTLHAPDWPNGVHRTQMHVRDSELDQFSVVNNSVYSVYFQHGRHEALRSMGAGVGEYQAAGVLMALSELVIKFKQPLRSGDAFRVETSVGAVSAARLVMRQAVVRETPGAPDQVCAEGSATVVAIDASHRPIRWPAKDRQVFAALQEKAAAAAAASGSE